MTTDVLPHMKTHRHYLLTIGTLLFAALASPGMAQTSPAPTTTPQATSSSVPADNAKRNQDASNRIRTADDQKENASDRALTQQIRKNVMADKQLSTYAHNVKIVAVDGTVTLNGVVRSDEEKMSVAQKAEAVAGAGHVVNKLKIQPSSK